MSRSNYDKPFYVDVGTSIVAIRCASNRDVVCETDYAKSPFSIAFMRKACDRMNEEFELYARSKDGDDAAAATTEKSSAVGNAAALRDALVAIRKALVMEGPCTEFHAEVDKLTASALAAPPRNCDRFGTVEEADAAYRRFREREIAKIPMDATDYSREVAKVPRRDRWIFSTADDQKGENNGSK